MWSGQRYRTVQGKIEEMVVTRLQRLKVSLDLQDYTINVALGLTESYTDKVIWIIVPARPMLNHEICTCIHMLDLNLTSFVNEWSSILSTLSFLFEK